MRKDKNISNMFQYSIFSASNGTHRGFVFKLEQAEFIQKILCSDRYCVDKKLLAENRSVKYKETTESRGNQGTIFEGCFFQKDRFSFQCVERSRSYQNSFMGRMESNPSNNRNIYSVTIDYSGSCVALVVKDSQNKVVPTHVLHKYLHPYTIELLNVVQPNIIPSSATVLTNNNIFN